MEIKVLASGSSGNCYVVGDGKKRLLLDCGIPIAKIIEGCDYNMDNVEACLVTHIHKDHSLAVKDLARRGIKVYGTLEMKDAGLPCEVMSWYYGAVLDRFTICPFCSTHDCDCYGYLIKDLSGDVLAYITDTKYIPIFIDDFDIDYWLIEANYSLEILDKKVADGTIDVTRANRVIDTHMSIEKLEEYFGKYDYLPAKAIYLVHLSNDNSDADDFKRRIEQVTGVPVYIA